MSFAKFIRLSFIIFFLVLGQRVSAQVAVQLTSDEGLSSSLVRNLYEDSRKNVWICTQNGLNRYDGAKINVYHHNEADAHSIGHDLATFVLEMDKDNIIVGHEKGLQAYNYATNQFQEIPMIQKSGDTLRTHVVSMSKFLDGKIHVCVTSAGTYELSKDESGKVISKFSSAYIYKDSRPTFILNTKKDEVWTITNQSDIVLFQGNRTTKFDEISGAIRLCQGRNGAIYAATAYNGIYIFDNNSRKFKKIENPALDDIVIKSIRSDGNGSIMISTDGNGLMLYNEKTNLVSQSVIRTAEYSLSHSNVQDALRDSWGNVWVAVYWKGVIVLPTSTSLFDYVGYRAPLKNTIGTTCVTSILPARDGGVWVGCDHSGLYHVNADGTESKHWVSSETGVPQTIGSMCEDSKGNLWLGSSIGSLVCMNVHTGTVTPFSKIIPEGENVRQIFDIQEDSDRNVWFATMGNGVFRYNAEKHLLENYADGRSGIYGILQNNWVSCLCVHGKNLYVGNASGLEIFAIGSDGALSAYKHILQGTKVNDIKATSKGLIWVGTDHGIYMIDSRLNIRNYTVADGLSNNQVCAIEIFETGQKTTIWASTANGLCSIDASSGAMKNFFIGDGLQGNEFVTHASSQKGDILYFGGINGYNYFNPNTIEKGYSAQGCDFRIVDLYLSGKSVHVGEKSGFYDILTEWISEAKEINLSHDDNTFSLELSTMSFDANHTAYEYNINGEGWVSLGEGQNRITFTNISPGTYDISIRAMGYSQQSNIKNIRVIIHNPWYATTIAFIIYFILLIAIGYIIFSQVKARLAAKKILLMHHQEEELNEARIQFFMNISHEIRTPMTLILAPLEKLKSIDTDELHQHNYQLIYQNAHRILRLINQLMDLRKIEKGQFRLEYSKVEIVSFLNSLKEVFEQSAQNRSINFTFHHEGVERLEAMVDMSSLDKIVMNLLSNAFKFTPDGGTITIQLVKNLGFHTLNTFSISVTDNGVGIPDEDKNKVFERFYSAKHQNGYIGTGIGLNLSALLVDLHKGTIRVNDNPDGSGARFVVTLPIEAMGNNATFSKNDDESATVREQELLHNHIDLQDAEKAEDKTIAAKHRNVLVVEDDAAIRQYIHSELANDFSITECSNGQEGWDYVQRNPDKVDLVISDIMMPVMEGTTLCQNIKTNFNTSHLPVILMSAKSSEADRIAGITIGADAYLTKPFNVELLRTTALNIIKQRQMLQGKFAMAVQKETKIDQVNLTSPDEHLIERVMKCINENLDNPDLNVEFIADIVGVSRVHFHRKIKEITGQTPHDFIKSIRLKEAARLLSEKHLDISNVSAATGFKSLSTFSTSFKQAFGMTPTEYMKRGQQ